MGTVIEPQPGSYILDFYLRSFQHLTIGKLGTFEFRRGHYLYCGSARGPGGLRARLSHHAKPSTRPHWHIDYLKQAAALVRIGFAHGEENMEHLWARALADQDGASIPIPGFGSSDCTCPSHLIFFPGGFKQLVTPPGLKWIHARKFVS